MFLWQNGSPFDSTMNKYTSAAFPTGIDPRTPAILEAFGAFNSSLDSFIATLPGGTNTSYRTSLEYPNILNSSSGPPHDTAIDTLLTGTS